MASRPLYVMIFLVHKTASGCHGYHGANVALPVDKVLNVMNENVHHQRMTGHHVMDQLLNTECVSMKNVMVTNVFKK